MPTLLFSMPLKPGKRAQYEAVLAECFGPRKDEYLDMLKRFHFNTVKIWIQEINGTEYAHFTHDADDDAMKMKEGFTRSSNPFDQWFSAQLNDCYDIESIDHLPAQPAFIGELG